MAGRHQASASQGLVTFAGAKAYCSPPPRRSTKLFRHFRFGRLASLRPRPFAAELDAKSALVRNPRLRRKVSRSSSLRATIRPRAALIPAMNGAGEESANRVKAGAASCAKRWAANLECRMVISSKFSTPRGCGSCRRPGDRTRRCRVSSIRLHCSSNRNHRSKGPAIHRQTTGLDRMSIVHQKQKHIAVAGIERRGVLGDVYKRVMRHRVPVEYWLYERKSTTAKPNVADPPVGSRAMPSYKIAVWRTKA